MGVLRVFGAALLLLLGLLLGGARAQFTYVGCFPNAGLAGLSLLASGLGLDDCYQAANASSLAYFAMQNHADVSSPLLFPLLLVPLPPHRLCGQS